MKRIGAVLFWVGLVITIVSVAVAIFSGIRAVDTVTTAVDKAAPMPNGSATVQLQEGDKRTIYEQASYEDSAQGTSSAVCEVSDPDGNAVDLSTSTDLSGSDGDVSVVGVGSFEASQTGAYQVECTGATTLIGPSLDFGELGSGALGVLGGILGAGLGLLLLVLGAVLWFVGRSRAKKAAAGPGGPYGSGGYNTGGYNTGGYGPPPPPSSGPPAGSGNPAPGSGPSSPGYGSTPPPPPPSGS